jgi:N-acetylmuramoyl-L-alanine amidase
MIALSAGHYPDAKGASWNSVYEYDLTPDWVNHIAWHLRNIESIVIVPTGILPSKIRFINSLPIKPDLAVEIHFNSDPSQKSSGSMTLYCPGSELGKHSARIVQDSLSQIFSPSHGIKEGWYQGISPPDSRAVPDAFLKQTVPVAIIIEPEYIWNLDTINRHKEEASETIAVALHEAAEQLRKVT